jgi:hypothetical protein
LTAPAFLQLDVADDDEDRAINAGLNQLYLANAANRDARDYYDGSRIVRDLGISTPPSMQKLQVVAGWPGTVVDVLEERLDWLGWSNSDGDDDYELDDIYAANDLDVESGMAHLDALIFGVSFVVVGAGDDGEPSPLITPASPMMTTGVWDRRLRRLSAALAVSPVLPPAPTDVLLPGDVTLYRPDETVTFTRSNGGVWRAVDRDRHNLGRVPVVLVPNRARGSRRIGRSEITRPVRYYTDAAARTMRGLETNREFYNAPQRVGLNIAEKMFQDAQGNPVSQWTAIQGRYLMIPPNDDDPAAPQPDVKQFTPASPAPYVDQIKGYATLLAAESGIPAEYLGFQTDNRSSADAIRAGEARLVKRAERRQGTFGRAWREVGRLALLIRDGAVPDGYDTAVSAKWRDAATPTRAAAADEVAKYVGAGILPADSVVALDRAGFSPAEQRTIIAERRRANVAALMQRVTGGGADAGTPVPAESPGPPSGV